MSYLSGTEPVGPAVVTVAEEECSMIMVLGYFQVRREVTKLTGTIETSHGGDEIY